MPFMSPNQQRQSSEGSEYLMITVSALSTASLALFTQRHKRLWDAQNFCTIHFSGSTWQLSCPGSPSAASLNDVDLRAPKS